MRLKLATKIFIVIVGIEILSVQRARQRGDAAFGKAS